MKTEKEWADFGKSIYDSAQKLFADRPIKEAVIPFKDNDGFICRAIIRDIPTYIVVEYTNGVPEFKHYYKKSDGTLTDTKWK